MLEAITSLPSRKLNLEGQPYTQFSLDLSDYKKIEEIVLTSKRKNFLKIESIKSSYESGGSDSFFILEDEDGGFQGVLSDNDEDLELLRELSRSESLKRTNRINKRVGKYGKYRRRTRKVHKINLSRIFSNLKNLAKNGLDLLIKDEESLSTYSIQNGNVKKDKSRPIASLGITSENRSLLLIHGIFSSIVGAFDSNESCADYFNELSLHYEGRVIGWDHFTIQTSIKQNAMDLIDKLPGNSTFDIICHSRGAGIVRYLLEHPDCVSRYKQKNIQFKRFVCVAGAPLGSNIASSRFISKLVNIHVLSSLFAGGLLNIILKVGIGALSTLPGIRSMNPNGNILEELAEVKVEEVSLESVLYIRSNYEPGPDGGGLRRLDEVFIDQVVFDGEPNDLVVPFHPAGISDLYFGGNVSKEEYSLEGSPIHMGFFDDERVMAKISGYLS